MTNLALALIVAPPVLFIYAYGVYPALLWLAAFIFRRVPQEGEVTDWPSVTLTVPVYNEARNIRDKLDELLQLDYPAGKLQILVISDASNDGTDEIVRDYESRGVE